MSLQPIADTPGAETAGSGSTALADAEIPSGGEREWRVVFMTDTAQRVTELWVFERPEPFQGVAGGTAIVVDGAVGAGKSTLMQQFADGEDTPWVVFDEVNFGRIHTSHLIWPEICGRSIGDSWLGQLPWPPRVTRS